MTGKATLPVQFRDLEPFVAEWAQPNERERLAKLIRVSLVELKSFYDAVYPRAEEIKTYLSEFKLDSMPDDAQKLLDLLLTFVETAHPIELKWTTTDIDDAFSLERMQIDSFKPYPPA
jgi:hypothetical protein